MKKVLVFVGCFLVMHSFAQKKFQGKATYKTHRKMNISLNKGKGAPSSKVQKQLEEQIKKMYQKTYTLYFTNNESRYTQNAKLNTPQPNQGGTFIKISGQGGGTDVLYKNIAQNRYINKTEVYSKRFLIKDTLNKTDWTLTDETKNIGIYTCYKAVKSREEERSKFTVVDGKFEEKKETVTIKTVAWYTPQIPVSNGPDMYGGLPGLILEVKDGKLTIVCSEIVINPKDKIVIKEPKKGKVITQTKFDKMMEKKEKEMMERFRSRRKSKKGSGFSISIGG